MTPTSILRELERLPLTDRIFVVEQASASIEAEKAQLLHSAVDSLQQDYQSDYDLTDFTRLDDEPFMEMAPKAELADKIAVGLKIAYERMLEFKRQKNSEVVVMRDGEIVRLKP